jgi:hypothetical protein
MQEQDTPRLRSNGNARLDFRPYGHQGMQQGSDLRLVSGIERLFTPQSGQGGITLHRYSPPGDQSAIAHTELLQAERVGLLHAQW